MHDLERTYLNFSVPVRCEELMLSDVCSAGIAELRCTSSAQVASSTQWGHANWRVVPATRRSFEQILNDEAYYMPLPASSKAPIFGGRSRRSVTAGNLGSTPAVSVVSHSGLLESAVGPQYEPPVGRGCGYYISRFCE